MKIRAIYTCVLFVYSAKCFASATPDVNATLSTQPVTAIAPAATPALPRTQLSQQDLLEAVRSASDQAYSRLQSFVCDEEMHRFKGRISGQSSRQIDRVTANVSFENGVEQYTGIRQNDRERPNLSSLAGAWSTGEFGTLLNQTQQLLKTQPVIFRMYTDLNGTAAAEFGFETSEQDSPWDLQVGAQHYRIPFRTEIWVSRENGEIIKIARVSNSMPAGIGISEIRWDVTLAPVQLSGQEWLLPKTADYAVLYEDAGRKEWNEMTFANYRRYGSEVALKFN